MNKRHWSTEDFLNDLYGVGSGSDHLDRCPECRARRNDLLAKRRQVVEGYGRQADRIPAGFLAEQRGRILERIASRSPQWERWRWVPAFAAASALAIGFVLYEPAPKPHMSAAISDSQFFAEIESVARGVEPAAADPLRSLFEEQ